jgi:lambda family phage portal protein
MLTDDGETNRMIEQEFLRWADVVALAEKLRTMRMARAADGEAFALLVANPTLDSLVKLDLRLLEADQVATPDLAVRQVVGNAVDGIVLDAFGNPVEYHVLRSHPGDERARLALDYDRIAAAAMIHYFRTDRPGQNRGIPEITPALPLFAQLRRYTLAVLAAAETAADFAAVLFTDAPANGEADPVEPMDLVELERRMATVLPGGWKLGQIQAEQPATTYGEFKKEILNEIARCLNMPFNVAAGNSSGYNYASGRLDHQTYYKSIRVDQSQLASVVLDRVLKSWLDEAILISDFLPLWMRAVAFRDLSHQWFWDGQEHVDPAKEATAQATRLASHTTTLAYEYARQGRDWESELRQRGKELALMRQLGLTVATAQSSAAQADTTDQQGEETANATSRAA